MENFTLFWRSSRAFPSSLTSLMEEMEVAVRVGLVAVGGFPATVGGFVTDDMLCRLKGALFTPSDTEARGLAADLTDAADPAGETTPARVAAEAGGAGLLFVEADNEGLVNGGAEGLEGTIDARLAGVAPEGAGREEDMGGFDGGADPEAELDFLRDDVAAAGLVAAVVEVTAGFDTAGFTDPAPKVPELMIYHGHVRKNVVGPTRSDARTRLTVVETPFVLVVADLCGDIGAFALSMILPVEVSLSSFLSSAAVGISIASPAGVSFG